jgi:hypothetical protein
MSMMTCDGVFAASSGNEVDDERDEGYEAVRAAYAAVFAQYPDAHWGEARLFVTETAACRSGRSRVPSRTGGVNRMVRPWGGPQIGVRTHNRCIAYSEGGRRTLGAAVQRLPPLFLSCDKMQREVTRDTRNATP